MPDLTLHSAGKLDDAGLANATMIVCGALAYVRQPRHFAGFQQYLLDMAVGVPDSPAIRDWIMRSSPKRLQWLNQLFTDPNWTPAGEDS